MGSQLDLREGETVLKEVSGDYWKKQFSFLYSQKRGKFWFTSERIIFEGGFATTLDLPYSDIVGMKKCNVGPAIAFIPTGIQVEMKDGTKHRLSVLGRKKIIELLETRMRGA